MNSLWFCGCCHFLVSWFLLHKVCLWNPHDCELIYIDSVEVELSVLSVSVSVLSVRLGISTFLVFIFIFYFLGKVLRVNSDLSPFNFVYREEGEDQRILSVIKIRGRLKDIKKKKFNTLHYIIKYIILNCVFNFFSLFFTLII